MKDFFSMPSGAVWMLRLWLVLDFLLSAQSVLFPRIKCLTTSLPMVREPYNFEKYPSYFHNDSILILAQTGKFVGAGGIEEYARFLTPSSPYLSFGPKIRFQKSSYGYNPKTGLCELFVVAKDEFITNSTFTSRQDHFYLVIMARAFIDPVERYITKIYIYFTVPLLTYFFGDLLTNDKTRNYVCGVLNNQCSNYTTAVQNCTDMLSTQSSGEGPLFHLDGYSQGCRALHAVLAATNPHHCPHLSFTPQADTNGLYKCQNTSGYQPVDFFSHEDFNAFKLFCIEHGIDYTQGYKVLSK